MHDANAYPQEDLLFIKNLLRTHAPRDARTELASRHLSVSPLHKGAKRVFLWAQELDKFS